MVYFVKKRVFCPLCGHELVKLHYVGSKRLHLSEKNDTFEDYLENGKVVWVLAKVKKYRSGSSGESKHEASQSLLVKPMGEDLIASYFPF